MRPVDAGSEKCCSMVCSCSIAFGITCTISSASSNGCRGSSLHATKHVGTVRSASCFISERTVQSMTVLQAVARLFSSWRKRRSLRDLRRKRCTLHGALRNAG